MISFFIFYINYNYVRKLLYYIILYFSSIENIISYIEEHRL